MTRRLLMDSLRKLATDGTKPVRCDDPNLWMVRAVSLTLPSDQTWLESGREPMTARLGADFGYAL
jgi:phthalate 4,5-dioxygenase oxygenase subunit